MNRNSTRSLVLRIGPNFLNYCLIIATLVISITPELNRNLSKSLWAMIIVLWYIDVLIKRTLTRSKSFKYVFFLALWVVYILTFRLVGLSSAAIGNYFLIIASFDIIIKALYVSEYYSSTEKRYLVRIIQLIVLMSLVQNIATGISEPNVFYYMYVFPERYVGRNIAVTQFYEMLSFFVGASTYLVFHEKKRSVRMLEIVYIVLALFFMMSFEPRFTAAFLALLIMALVLINHRGNMGNRLLTVMLIILVFFVVLVLFRNVIIEALPERISVRLRAILSLNSSGLGGSEYTRRFELQLNSLKTFLSSPITFLIGAGWHLGSDYSGVIGQHAMLTDYLASYGIIGLAFIVSFFTGLKKSFSSFIESKNYLKNGLLVIFISSLITNPIRPEVLPLSVFMLSVIDSVTENVQEE